MEDSCVMIIGEDLFDDWSEEDTIVYDFGYGETLVIHD